MKPSHDETPLVSVIIPTYNQGAYIGRAVASVLNQTIGELELIIVDNFSSDNTCDIVSGYNDARIKYFKINNKGTIASSRNFGINHSKGEFIAFLDSDDVWLAQKLEKQMPHFQSPGIIGVASDAILLPETPYYRKINYGRSASGHIDYYYKGILDYNPIITSSLIVRRETFGRAGFFDESSDFRFIEDWELWLRMSRHGVFRVLGEPLLSYTVSRKRGEQSVEISKNCLKIMDRQLALGYVHESDLVEPKVLIYLDIARHLLDFDRRQSRAYYIKALKNAVDIRQKIKSGLGAFISCFPDRFMNMTFEVLYKADRILCDFNDRLWKAKHKSIASKSNDKS